MWRTADLASAAGAAAAAGAAGAEALAAALGAGAAAASGAAAQRFTGDTQVMARAPQGMAQVRPALTGEAAMMQSLRQFGQFASSIGRGLRSAEQFLGNLNGHIDRALGGKSGGSQFAERLSGMEGQLKGLFDNLKGLLNEGMKFINAAQGQPAAAQPAAGGAAAASPSAPAASPSAPAASPSAPDAGGASMPVAPAGAQRSTVSTADGGSLTTESHFDASKGDYYQGSRSEFGGGGGYVRDSASVDRDVTTRTEFRTEYRTEIRTEKVARVENLPGQSKTDQIHFPNAVPRPGDNLKATKPEDLKSARDTLAGISADDLRKPGVKIDISSFASHRGDSAGYNNNALTERRGLYTREAYAKALKEKGLSDSEINKILPSPAEIKAKAYGSSQAKEPEKASIEKQQPDRRTDVTINIPGGQRTVYDDVQKEVKVPYKVPVQVQEEGGFTVRAGDEYNIPGLHGGAATEYRFDKDGNMLDVKHSEFERGDHDAILRGAGSQMDPFAQALLNQQKNLGPLAPPVNEFFASAATGQPSAAPFEPYTQAFGQGIRDDVLTRNDLPPSMRSGIEGMAGRVDANASQFQADVNRILAQAGLPPQ